MDGSAGCSTAEVSISDEDSDLVRLVARELDMLQCRISIACWACACTNHDAYNGHTTSSNIWEFQETSGPNKKHNIL